MGGIVRGKLSRVRLDAYDEDLLDYRNINHRIAVRKVEIETQKNEDERVGSSSGAISKIPEQLAIKYDEDETLRSLYTFRSCVDRLVKNLSDENKQIFALRWMEELSWQEIAFKMHHSERNIYKKRTFIITRFAEIQGKI